MIELVQSYFTAVFKFNIVKNMQHLGFALASTNQILFLFKY